MRIVRNKTDNFLTNLPELEDRHILCVLKVMIVFALKAHMSGLDHFVLKFSVFLAEYPIWSLQPYSFFICKIFDLMIAIVGNVKAVCQFGQLSKVIINTYNERAMIPMVHLMIYVFLNHWRDPIQMTLGPLLNDYQIGLEFSDIEYSTYAENHHCIHILHSGQNIDSLIEQQQTCLQQ